VRIAEPHQKEKESHSHRAPTPAPMIELKKFHNSAFFKMKHKDLRLFLNDPSDDDDDEVDDNKSIYRKRSVREAIMNQTEALEHSLRLQNRANGISSDSSDEDDDDDDDGE